MKNILYLTNYMDDKIINARKNSSCFSQAGNNKVVGIVKSISSLNNKITVISSGLVNNKSFKKYSKLYSEILKQKVIYSEIIDIPFINTLSSIYYNYKNIKALNKQEHIDNIIFYNYKPELAFSAYLAKKKLGIPITIEYEDGYSNVKEISKLKRIIFSFTEKIVSKKIDSAILVNSKIQKEIDVPFVVVRGVVNENLFKKCKDLKKNKNKRFKILYSGGLDKVRGIDILIKALKYLDFDYLLTITGKGELNIQNDNVDFKGFISHEEMTNLMIESDLLVQCQLVSDEFSNYSFPSKLFEYIATLNYIISSNIPDVVEFAKGYEGISFYDNDDSKKLAEEIKKVYEYWKKGNLKNEKLLNLCNDNLPEEVGKKIMSILL